MIKYTVFLFGMFILAFDYHWYYLSTADNRLKILSVAIKCMYLKIVCTILPCVVYYDFKVYVDFSSVAFKIMCD